MPTPRETSVPSDSRRDAERHHRLLLALDRATGEIRHIEREGQPDIDEVLDRLLPDLAAALNAEQAFVAVLREDGNVGEKWLELTTVYPTKQLCGHHLEWSGLLQKLIEDGDPKVIDPLGEEARRDPIPGLEIFDATSAVLVRMETPGQVRVVGICNKAAPNLGPYLAADRMALDSIVELVAIGARIGERRRRELEGIQKTSAAISAELELDGLLPMIARRASEVFDAPATSLMLWDEGEENLLIKASWGLSDEYVQQQSIPREKAYTAISSSGEFLPFTVVDLRLEPFGQVEPIERERLCSVLVVPLEVAGEPIGALNVYSKDTPRPFTQDEKELARIFGNQAVIAIQNAQVYQHVTKRAKAMESLEKVGRIITADLDLHQVLRLIVENATKVLEADISSVFFLDENTREWFPFGIGNLHGTIQTLPREWMPQSKGLAARVVKDKELLVVEDVGSQELAAQSKIVIAERIQSFACCPLLAGEDVFGLLYVDFCAPHRFTNDERQTIQMFANQAAIAIKNAMQYEDIEKAYKDAEKVRGELAATEAVAWMGILGSSWSHGVNQKSFAIRNYVEVLRALMPPELEVEDVLSQIETAADDIKNIPITQPLPTTPGTGHSVVEIDDALQKQVQKWCRPRQDIHVQFDLHCPHVQAQIDREWLEVALEKLVSNALKAMANGGTLTVSSERVRDQVRICLADTGHGIPDYAREHFLKDRIPKEDGSGTGVGVLIARLIFRRYGGELALLWTEPGLGTILEILLPVEGASPQA